MKNKADCKIPTLEEVLEFIKDTDLTLNIEIKNNKVRYKNIEKDILDIVKQYEMEDKVVISSFNYKSLKKNFKLNSKVKLLIWLVLLLLNVET